MLTLSNLHSPGATRNRKRLGRGQGSGQGKQAGKGHKGQKARTGGGIRTGFEGGQMPIYRRLPKRGFSNAPFKKEFAIINLDALNERFEGAVVNRDSLINQGFLSGSDKKKAIKVLAKGEISKSLEFQGIEKFSESAKKAIEAAGGKLS